MITMNTFDAAAATCPIKKIVITPLLRIFGCVNGYFSVENALNNRNIFN
jgi:hypothetical protein